jgi:hypothetical protein
VFWHECVHTQTLSVMKYMCNRILVHGDDNTKMYEWKRTFLYLWISTFIWFLYKSPFLYCLGYWLLQLYEPSYSYVFVLTSVFWHECVHTQTLSVMKYIYLYNMYMYINTLVTKYNVWHVAFCKAGSVLKFTP